MREISLQQLCQFFEVAPAKVYGWRANVRLHFPPPILSRPGLHWYESDVFDWWEFILNFHEEIALGIEITPPQYIAVEPTCRQTVPPEDKR